jgi:phospholipase C
MEILARPEILPIRHAVSASPSHGRINGFARARNALRKNLHYEIIHSKITARTVPARRISPFARHGFVDHNEYETVSILKLIEKRFYLQPLAARDADPTVSDLTSGFVFRRRTTQTDGTFPRPRTA